MATPKESSTTTKNRLVILLVGIVLIFIVLIIRLGYIQVVQAGELQEKALGQWTRNLTVTAKRGEITDRNGQVLAQSASAWTIVITPSRISDERAAEVAMKLAEVLEMDETTIAEKIADKTKQQHIIKRQVRREVGEKVVALKLPGVSRAEDTIRAYPMGTLLSQVIGFTDVSGQGQTGVELSYDKYLKGVNGKVVTETANGGVEMPYNADVYVAPEDGQDIVLTIDYIIQSIAEKASREALEVNMAKGVQTIVMDVNTGEILAMVNLPDFDLNNPPRTDMELLNQLTRNKAMSDAYEPGSTFKILTTAAALESGATNINAGFNCTGSIIVDGDKIRCWRTGLPHGHQTLTEAMMNSCNPVFVQLALSMGRDTFYSYLSDFGIGQKTGVDMRGESTGQVISIKYVKDVDLARVGFGQSVSVTPLQLITAACATVNGGNLMQPYIVKAITSDDGEIVQSNEPKVVSNPISQATSDIMREMLEATVSDGGGRNAYIPGYRVGGKTGTAQKYDESGRIMSDVHVSSFIGFAPMDDPQIAVLFVVDEPGIRPDYGSTVAAPFAKDILENALKHLGVQPIYEDGEQALVGQMVAVPDLTDMKAKDAMQVLQTNGLRWILDGLENEPIVEQSPVAGTVVPAESIVVIYTLAQEEEAPSDAQTVIVPDVTNMSIVEANRLLRHAGLEMGIKGSGLAVSQSPQAGTQVKGGSKISVEFEEP